MTRTGAAKAIVASVLAILLSAAPLVGGTVEDLLFDLQLVPLDGQPSHEFTLPGLDSKAISLSQFKGHVVLLYFWATW